MSRTPRTRFASLARINDQGSALISTAGQMPGGVAGRSRDQPTPSVAAYRKMTQRRKSKYNNVRTMVDGEMIDSKREAKRWRQLQLMELAGHITDLKRQVVFELAPRAVFKKSRASPAIRYVADFAYYENGEYVVEDAKSPISRRLPVFRLKRHLMMTQHGLEIRES